MTVRKGASADGDRLVMATVENFAANSADPDVGSARPCNDAVEASGYGRTSSPGCGTSEPAGLNLAQGVLL